MSIRHMINEILSIIYVDTYISSWPIETFANEASMYISMCQTSSAWAQESWTLPVSEVIKKDINTVQFLAQTDRFMS